MYETKRWDKIKENGVPYEVIDFIDEMERTEQKLNFSCLDLGSKEGRKYIRYKLLKARKGVSDSLRKFNEFLMKGGNKKKREKLQNLLKEWSTYINNIEARSKGKFNLRSGDPGEMMIQKYHTALNDVIRNLIFESMLGASEKDGDFYNNLVDNAYNWCVYHSFSARIREEGEREEEGEEEREDLEIEDDLFEGIGVIR